MITRETPCFYLSDLKSGSLSYNGKLGVSEQKPNNHPLKCNGQSPDLPHGKVAGGGYFKCITASSSST